MCAEAKTEAVGQKAENKSAPVEKPEVEKQTNCLGCNKPLKKLRRYYRNGKYYCSKKCWVNAVKSQESKK